MEELYKLIESMGIPNLSWIVGIISIIYFFANTGYDLMTKSDLEKSLSYKGKDRILFTIIIFVYCVLASIISAFEIILVIFDQYNLLVAIIVVFAVSLILSLIFILIFSIADLIFIVTGLNAKYEVKYSDEKDEFWEINKVAKDNSVILERDGVFKVIPDVKELNYKEIRQRKREKKIKKKS
ncbi:hypothetical protein [Paraliobacillus sp. X-1268]|uniref:hypothetical protein n=1 Tax=Paraliobacillus sp. X-1268 TaxID=2213193 RepID=UPI000E3D8498|nr:hypothetical protein [Paraliobacillus sp. X-1268]